MTIHSNQTYKYLSQFLFNGKSHLEDNVIGMYVG